MNCSSFSVLDSSRWLSSGEHSVSYSPERGCQWWTDPWGVPATHIFKSQQACCSFFSPSPMEVENPQDSEVDSEVLGLKYPFVCLLCTWVSAVGRSFCIHHFMVLRVSASLPLRLFWFEVTMLSLEVLFFWESEQSIMIVLPLMGDDPSQYYTIVSTRQMRTVSESPESYDFIHLLTQHCYIRESNPPRKYFFVPGPITKPLLSWS